MGPWGIAMYKKISKTSVQVVLTCQLGGKKLSKSKNKSKQSPLAEIDNDWETPLDWTVSEEPSELGIK